MGDNPEDLPLGGYVPGNYWDRCLSCGGTFRGDKRCLTCRGCALGRAAADGARREVVPYPLPGAKVRVTDRSRYYADWQGVVLIVTGVDLLPSGVVTVTTAESDGLGQYGGWRNPTDGWAPDELALLPTPPQPDPVAAAWEAVVKAAMKLHAAICRPFDPEANDADFSDKKNDDTNVARWVLYSACADLAALEKGEG